MQVSSNVNSMMQLSNQLEKSANELAKLNKSSENSLKNEQQNTQTNDQTQKESISEPDIAKEMVEQIQIPIAYDANAEVISVQDSTTKTLLDIKA